MKTWVLFDWGDTLMRVFPEYRGPMKTWRRVEEMPGARKALHALHGRVGLALATNAEDSTETDIREALGRVDLDAFMKRVFCYRALGIRKSDPGYFPNLLKELKVDAAHVVMVGDDLKEDVEAAREAGLHGVWFNTRTQDTKVGHNLTTIHHLEALPGVLMGWGLLPRE